MVNTLISESKLFRASGGYNRFNGRDIADLAYANTLAVLLLSMEPESEKTARSYAQKTAQFSSYAIFRSHATDLYLQAYVLSFPNNANIKLHNHSSSTKFVQSLQFQGTRHVLMMRRVAQGIARRAEITQFLHRLERQLSISSSKLRLVRQWLVKWHTLGSYDKQRAVTALLQEMRSVARSTQLELYNPLRKLAGAGFRDNEALDARRGDPSWSRKAAGAGLGAAAGYHLAPDKYKKAGTIAGGIAGYKLSSGRSQR
jgi:hypothetical protein